jgi:hypothetical protein
MNQFLYQGVMRVPSRISLRLVQSPAGRILLHLSCLARDHRFRWHWQGILREL